MRCMKCSLSLAQTPARYSTVLVLGSADVRSAVERVSNVSNESGVSIVAPGCTAYCARCKRVTRLATSDDAQTALLDGTVLQDRDIAVFGYMQTGELRLY